MKHLPKPETVNDEKGKIVNTEDFSRHGTLVQVFTQMTGINVINYYQTILYEGLGFVGNTGTLVAGIYNCVGPIANLIFITLLLDRVGRRKPLIFGTIGITIALVCSAILTSQNPDGHRRDYSIGGVFFIFCVSIVFSFSFGPISWYVQLPLLLKTGLGDPVKLIEKNNQGIHVRSHAYANSRKRQRLRNRCRKLGRRHTLESSIPNRHRGYFMAVFLCLRHIQ